MGSSTVSDVHEPSGLDRDKEEKGVWNSELDNDSFGRKYGTTLSNRPIDGLPGFQHTWKCQLRLSVELAINRGVVDVSGTILTSDRSIWRRWAARTNWAYCLGLLTSQKWPSPIIISIPAGRSVPSLRLPPRSTEPSSLLRAVSWRDGESFRSSRFISTPLDFSGTRC